MADNFNAQKFGMGFAIPFSTANATTGLSNADLSRAGGGTGWVAPKAGSVIAIGARSAAAITAGTMTVQAHSASTELTDAGAPSAALTSGAQASYAVVRPGAVRFAAGDVLGLSVTTTTTLDPTNTLDIDGELYVALDPE